MDSQLFPLMFSIAVLRSFRAFTETFVLYWSLKYIKSFFHFSRAQNLRISLYLARKHDCTSFSSLVLVRCISKEKITQSLQCEHKDPYTGISSEPWCNTPSRVCILPLFSINFDLVKNIFKNNLNFYWISRLSYKNQQIIRIERSEIN